MEPMAFCFTDGGKEFTTAILEALGLEDAPVASLELRIDAKSPLVARIELVPDDDQAAAMAKVVRRFAFPTALELVGDDGGTATHRGDGRPVLDADGKAVGPDGWRDRASLL